MASEREWLPRRHHRRLGEWERRIPAVERVKATAAEAHWSGSLSSVTGTLKERTSDLQRSVQQSMSSSRAPKEFTMSMSAQPSPVSRGAQGLSSVPALGWAAAAVAAGAAILWRFPGILDRMRPGAQRRGRWVRDRSMGGKLVFIPDEPSSSGDSWSASKDFSKEVDALASEAARWRASVAEPRALVREDNEMPLWWNPPRYSWAPEDRKETLRKQARKLLKELEDTKLAGNDYPLWTLVELQNKCSEGKISVEPSTMSGRDAMLRAGMEAAMDAVASGSNITIGNLDPTRFVSGLAEALSIPDEKAKAIANGSIAARSRSLLLAISAGFRAGRREDIVVPVLHLAAVLTTFTPTKGSPESDMMAASIRNSATLDERKGVMRLIFELAPEVSEQAAEMLGFDPDLVLPLLREEKAAGEAPKAAAEAPESEGRATS